MGGEGTGDPGWNRKRGIGSTEGGWWSGDTQEFGEKKPRVNLEILLVLTHSTTARVNQVPVVLGTLPWCVHT